MAIEYRKLSRQGISTQIADSIREAILGGDLVVDERLPSETELADRFGVSRPTVREALKRLAAQNLIRTQRGASGGAFVNRITWSEAHDSLVTTATLLIGMNEIGFDEVAEARFALERACVPLSVARREEAHLEAMRREVALQRDRALSDEDFCASDVRFHRALVDGAGNAVLSFQMAGVVEAVQPLMNMLTYRARDRARIADLHESLCNTIRDGETEAALMHMTALETYTIELAQRSEAGRPAAGA